MQLFQNGNNLQPNNELTGVLVNPFSFVHSDARVKNTPSHVYVMPKGPHPIYLRILGLEGTGTGRAAYVSGDSGGADSCFYLLPEKNYLLQNCALKRGLFEMVQLEMVVDGPTSCSVLWSPDAIRRDTIHYTILTGDDLRPWPAAAQVEHSIGAYELVKSQIAQARCPGLSRLQKSSGTRQEGRRALDNPDYAENKGRMAARTAMGLCGKSFQLDGVGPNGFCALGLLKAALHGAGVRVERLFAQKSCADVDRLGAPVDVNALMPGDALLLCGDFCGKTCDLGVVCGEGAFVRADRLKGVLVEDLDAFWAGRLRGARRLWL